MSKNIKILLMQIIIKIIISNLIILNKKIKINKICKQILCKNKTQTPLLLRYNKLLINKNKIIK